MVGVNSVATERLESAENVFGFCDSGGFLLSSTFIVLFSVPEWPAISPRAGCRRIVGLYLSWCREFALDKDRTRTGHHHREAGGGCAVRRENGFAP
jgi:hypothetical protein